MIYKLTTKDLEKEKIYYYNNIENSFYDESFKKIFDNGISFEEKIEKEKKKIFNFDFNLNSITTESLEDFRLVLGNKCNFHCKHCIQRNDTFSYKFNDEDIDKIIKYLMVFPNLKRFIFCLCGEPFYYWKVIKKVILKVREYLNKDIMILINSNGSMIDKEKIDFLIKNNIDLNLSYDGEISYRDKDILSDENIISVLKYGKENGLRFKFKFLPLKDNSTFFETKKKIKKLFGEDTKVYTAPNTLKFCNKTISKESVKLSEDEKNKILSDYICDLKNSKTIKILKNKILKNDTILLGNGFPLGKSIECDLRGNVYNSQHNLYEKYEYHIIGSIYNFDKISLRCYIQRFFKEECLNCPYIQFCDGGIYVKHNLDKEIINANCFYSSLRSFALLKILMDEIFGVELQNVEICEKICNTI